MAMKMARNFQNSAPYIKKISKINPEQRAKLGINAEDLC